MLDQEEMWFQVFNDEQRKGNTLEGSLNWADKALQHFEDKFIKKEKSNDND